MKEALGTFLLVQTFALALEVLFLPFHLESSSEIDIDVAVIGIVSTSQFGFIHVRNVIGEDDVEDVFVTALLDFRPHQDGPSCSMKSELE